MDGLPREVVWRDVNAETKMRLVMAALDDHDDQFGIVNKKLNWLIGLHFSLLLVVIGSMLVIVSR